VPVDVVVGPVILPIPRPSSFLVTRFWSAASPFLGPLYSFVAYCKRLGGDPFASLKDVLERLPTHSIDRLAELLPDSWFAAHPRARRKIAS
jgi:hypothetical protein